MLGNKIIMRTLTILLYRLLRIVSLFYFLFSFLSCCGAIGMLCWNVDFAIRLYTAFASLVLLVLILIKLIIIILIP